MENENLFDVVIIGAGVAGLGAGMYCGRFNMKTLVLGEMPGGTITTTDLVENYPGILSVKGPEMGSVFLEHAQKFGAQVKFSSVQSVEKTSGADSGLKHDIFKVKTGSEEFFGKTVIFATGTQHKKLGVPGEKEFHSKGVSYCALCDGAFFKNKTCCIAGGGDSSAIEALILANQCAKVYMFVRRDIMRAEPINYKKVIENPKIEVRYKTEIAQIKGKDKVSSVVLKSGEEIAMDGVFVAVGYDPLSQLAEKLGVALDEKKQIKINRNSQTNIPGVFAAGDVCDSAFKQAITGAAEAVIASYFANQYLQKK